MNKQLKKNIPTKPITPRLYSDLFFFLKLKKTDPYPTIDTKMIK